MNQTLSLELIRKYANKVPTSIVTSPDFSPLAIAQEVSAPTQNPPQSRSSLPVIIGVLMVVGAFIVYFEYQENKKSKQGM